LESDTIVSMFGATRDPLCAVNSETWNVPSLQPHAEFEKKGTSQLGSWRLITPAGRNIYSSEDYPLKPSPEWAAYLSIDLALTGTLRSVRSCMVALVEAL